MLDSDPDDQSDSGQHHGDDDDQEELIKRLKRWERLAKAHWGKWRDEAKLSYDYVAGKQWSSGDKAELLEQMRQPVTFNRIAPMVDGVLGAEILNRQETRYMPREQGDVQINEIITAADEWARDLADTEDEESDAFSDVVIAGVGWTETRMDYSEDPEGRIIDDRIDPLEMWADPEATKRNLVDRQYQIRARWRDKESLPPKWKKKLPTTTHGASSIDQMDTGESGPRDDYDREEDKAKEDGDNEKRRVFIRHFQWFEKETVYRVADEVSGQVATLEKAKFKELVQLFLGMGQKPPQAVKIEMNKYYEAFVAGSTILEKKSIECNAFTFQCITGKRDKNAGTFFGVVRAMIDPQMWGNKFFVQIMHILNTSARGGLLYEEGAFTNPQEALENWSRPDKPIKLKNGALSGQKPKVIEREQRVFPAGTDKMMEFALNNLPQTSGINLEMLGLVEREQAGVLEEGRKKAGYAILAVFFDSLRRYRKSKGRVRLHFIQNYLSDGRLIRIKGKDGTQKYVPLVKQSATATYDVIVDDAPMSPNQKEATWRMIMGLMPMLAKLNVPPEVWQVLLEASPLPSIVSGKINQIISEKAQEPPPPDPEMEKIKGQMQIAQQGAQLDAQGKQMDAQLEQQKMGAELQMKREEHQLEMVKLRAEIDAMREKTQLQLYGQQQKMAMDAHQQNREMQFAEREHEDDLEFGRESNEQKLVAAKEMGKVKVKMASKMNGQRRAEPA